MRRRVLARDRGWGWCYRMVNPNLECDMLHTDRDLCKCKHIGLGLVKCAWKLHSRCFHERMLCVSVVGKATDNY